MFWLFQGANYLSKGVLVGTTPHPVRVTTRMGGRPKVLVIVVTQIKTSCQSCQLQTNEWSDCLLEDGTVFVAPLICWFVLISIFRGEAEAYFVSKLAHNQHDPGARAKNRDGLRWRGLGLSFFLSQFVPILKNEKKIYLSNHLRRARNDIRTC